MRQPYDNEFPAIQLARQNGGHLHRMEEGTWRGRRRDLPRRVDETVVLRLVRRGLFDLYCNGGDGWIAVERAEQGRPAVVVVNPEGTRPRFQVRRR